MRWWREGLAVETLDAGGCGMAGAFGFCREHSDVSWGLGKLALLLRVRAASPDAGTLADGFSCRTQIERLAVRRAHHLADLLVIAADTD